MCFGSSFINVRDKIGYRYLVRDKDIWLSILVDILIIFMLLGKDYRRYFYIDVCGGVFLFLVGITFIEFSISSKLYVFGLDFSVVN